MVLDSCFLGPLKRQLKTCVRGFSLHLGNGIEQKIGLLDFGMRQINSKWRRHMRYCFKARSMYNQAGGSKYKSNLYCSSYFVIDSSTNCSFLISVIIRSELEPFVCTLNY